MILGLMEASMTLGRLPLDPVSRRYHGRVVFRLLH